jgi:Protein of unknown function (DUF2934)
MMSRAEPVFPAVAGVIWEEPVDRDIQDRIAARANALWQAYGHREGCEAEYLYQARREVELNDQMLAFKKNCRRAMHDEFGPMKHTVAPARQ